MESQIIEVGTAEMAVSQAPCILKGSTLGSCVAIILYDPIVKIGGLAHIELPAPETSSDKANKAKFATTAIEELFSHMERKGARRQNIIAKIVGGADTFPEIIPSDSTIDVGNRNILAAREELKRHNIEIIAEEVGDHIGRTVLFDTTVGSVVVKTPNLGERKY